MPVVLRECPHAHDAVQTAGRLVAVALPKLTVAQRQVPVAFDALLEDQDVPRTVHRLERVFTLFRFGREHVLSVLVPMPGLFPKRLVQDLGAFDFLIAVVAVDATHVLLHFLPQRPALGMPEHGAGRVFIDVEQIQFAAQLAVVPLFSFFQHREVLLQFLLGGPGGTVNALQHFVAMIAPPVSSGHLHQLEVLELASAGHVWPAAQVFKAALAIQADILIAGDTGNDLGFVVLAQGFEVRHGFVARQHAPCYRFVLASQVRHALFNGFEVFRGKGPLVGEIVEKTVFDHRANRDLRLGEQLFDRISQQMGRGVANHFQALGILGGHDRKRAVFLDSVAGVNDLVAHLASKRGFGQPSANRSGYLGHGDRA